MTPDDALWQPTDNTRQYTAEVGEDVEEVTLALTLAENVTVEDGIVSFDAVDDDADPLVADLDVAEVTAGINRVDGVVRTATAGPITVPVEDGTVTFRIAGDSDELVRPVVYVEDEDEEALVIDEDGLPVDDFGIGGITGFADVEAIEVDTDQTTVGDAADGFQAVEGTEFTFDAVLATDNFDFDNGTGFAVAAPGQEISYRVVDDEDFNDYEWTAVPGDAIVQSGTVAVEDGVASIPVDGSDAEADEDDIWIVLLRWEGAGEYDGEGPLFRQGDAGAIGIEWVEEPDVTVDEVDLSPVLSLNEAGGTHTVTATVEDSAGDPVEGVEVTFTNEGNVLFLPTVEETNADGEATLTFAGPDDATAGPLVDGVRISAAIDDGDDNVDTSDTAWVAKWWYEEAEDGDSATDGPVPGAAVAAGLIYAFGDSDGAALLEFDLDQGDVFQINGEAVGRTAFNNALADRIDEDDAPFAEWVADLDIAAPAPVINLGLTVTNYDEEAINTTFNLLIIDDITVDFTAADFLTNNDAVTDATVTATVNDTFGDPVANGTDVVFEITDQGGTDATFNTAGGTGPETVEVAGGAGQAGIDISVSADQAGTIELTVTAAGVTEVVDIIIDTTED